MIGYEAILEKKLLITALNLDDESGRVTPASSVAGGTAGGLQPRPAPTGLAALVAKNIGYRKDFDFL